jgi:hypothetical protein
MHYLTQQLRSKVTTSDLSLTVITINEVGLESLHPDMAHYGY